MGRRLRTVEHGRSAARAAGGARPKPKAKAFFETLRGANRYALIYRVHTAKKPETKAKRVADFIARLERGETIHQAAKKKQS